jgi:hypothetical protein
MLETDKWINSSTRTKIYLSVFLFSMAFLVYISNGDIVEGNDARPNLYLPVSLLSEGNLSFSPEEMPFMFHWRLDSPAESKVGSFRHPWGPKHYQKWYDLYRSGKLVPISHKYYIVPSTKTGLYVNTFGPGAGLTALPLYLILHLGTEDLYNNTKLIWYGGKFASSILVALSVVFVFLCALCFIDARSSFIIALVYALGTCVWSISSQSLLQHAPNGFYLTLGSLFLFRIGRWRYSAIWCGLCFALAVTCRPTSALTAGVIGTYLLFTNRRAFWAFMSGAVPVALLYCGYNWYYLGSPFSFGQYIASYAEAVRKTGNPDLWQTPVWLGAVGLMFSPAGDFWCIHRSWFLLFMVVGKHGGAGSIRLYARCPWWYSGFGSRHSSGMTGGEVGATDIVRLWTPYLFVLYFLFR